MWGCSERFPFAICSFFSLKFFFLFSPFFLVSVNFCAISLAPPPFAFWSWKHADSGFSNPFPFSACRLPLNRQPFRRTTCPLIESRTSLSGKPIKQVELFIGKERRIERNKKRGPHRKAHKSCAWYTTKWGNGATRLIMLTFCRTADSLLFC